MSDSSLAGTPRKLIWVAAEASRVSGPGRDRHARAGERRGDVRARRHAARARRARAGVMRPARARESRDPTTSAATAERGHETGGQRADDQAVPSAAGTGGRALTLDRCEVPSTAPLASSACTAT